MNEKMKQLRKALNAKFFERSDLIDGMLTALLSGEMLFILGPPGTAKSAICEDLCKAFGGNFFAWLVTKFTTPEEIFGPLSLKSLEQDKYERVTSGKLPEADIAFLDEIFKGSSAILNTLLPVINERIFYNGSTPTNIPLQVLFGASNELPQGDELAALYDRFALRFVVDRMGQDSSVEALFKSDRKAKVPKIPAAVLKAEQMAASQIDVPDSIVKVLVELRRTVGNEGIYVSDRKWMQSISVLKGYAYLNGHSSVTADDLEVLEHMLWASPDQIKQIRRIVGKYCNPLGEKILQITDAIQDVVEKLNKNEITGVEAHRKAKDSVKKLEGLGDPKSNRKLEKAIQDLKAVNLHILREHLGLEDM